MIKTAQIRDKRWRIIDSSLHKGRELGYCTNPILDRELAIPVHGDTKEELDTIIHEVLHASNWDLSEEAIEETATSLADILWRLGWRNE